MSLMPHLTNAFFCQKGISRRGFLKGTVAALFFTMFHPFDRIAKGASNSSSPLFWIKDISDQPFYHNNSNYHVGIDSLLLLMGTWGLKFYRSSQVTARSGPSGLIAPHDIVLIKVNGQWKYRGCTNSDLIRGLIQRILDHPDGFSGEVVIFENGQSQGSLNGDALGWGSYPDQSIHANANDESHSFNYLVNTVFNDPRVSSYLLDPIRTTFIGDNDHTTHGYRKYENVSYPCFTTAGGHRVELMEGLWQGSGYTQNLKLINVPVLKHHDTGGSEITAALKHFYGIVSMADGQSSFRHYAGLGETCGKMMVSVRAPVLNIIDAIWVSHASISGYPAGTTHRANQILASQDPVALDYCAAKYILYPIDNNPRHHPSFAGIDQWLTGARDTINSRGGLSDPESGILVDQVTKNEGEMVVYDSSLAQNRIIGIGVFREGKWFLDINNNRTWEWPGDIVYTFGLPGDIPVVGDWNGDGVDEIGVFRDGKWYLGKDGDGTWEWPGDTVYTFGKSGDIPIVGDWNGDGFDEIGVFRDGKWFLDMNGDGTWEWPGDIVCTFGLSGDIPVVGDWNGDGFDEIGVFRNGKWFLDKDGSGSWEWPSSDDVCTFGLPGDKPVTGKW